MGHAGAMISGSSGTADAKNETLEAKGVRVGKSPTETAQLAVEALGAALITSPFGAAGASSRARAGRDRRRAQGVVHARRGGDHGPVVKLGASRSGGRGSDPAARSQRLRPRS